MVWFVSMAWAAVLCGGWLIVGVVLWSVGAAGSARARIGKVVVALAVIAILAWPGGYTASRMVKVVEDGHVAIVYQHGEIVGGQGDGLQVIAPWQTIRTESTRAEEHTYTDVRGFSAETLDVVVSVTVVYRVEREMVLDLYRHVGPDWFDILTEPRVRQFFKAEVVLYDADEVVANGEAIEGEVRDALVADMEHFGVAVEGLEISDWTVWDR